ncbi:MAG: nuclear transport factor 2 family protein [Microthrixaceae bacterium]|nr:nuclear transport factor 2 family protein [Microthrixaceae bacterium]
MPTEPMEVTEAFLEALASGEVERAASYLAEDVVYTNVGLSVIRGRPDVTTVMKALDRSNMGFEVYIHSSATSGTVVLNERTDVIIFGPVRTQFWVCGRFEVRDGLITVWRDYFDTFDVLARSGVGCWVRWCRRYGPSLRSRREATPAGKHHASPGELSSPCELSGLSRGSRA